jgi:hypothetical protein
VVITAIIQRSKIMTTATAPTPTEQQALELAIAALKALKNRKNSLTVVRAIDSLYLILDAQND